MIYAEPTAEELELDGPYVYFVRFMAELDRLNDNLATAVYSTYELTIAYGAWWMQRVGVWSFEGRMELVLPPQEQQEDGL